MVSRGHFGIPRAVRVSVGVLCVATHLARADDGPTPTLTAAVGAGNSFGWSGGHLEYYIAHGRISGFLGAGYMHGDDKDPNLPTGSALAAGARGFTEGRKHRAYIEVSVSVVGREWVATSADHVDKKKRYGPGIQLGYQRISDGGFTFVASGGVGYAPGANKSSADALFGLGIGYTWRARRAGH